MENDDQSGLKLDTAHPSTSSGRGMTSFSKKGALLGLIAYAILIAIITLIFIFG